MLEDYVFVDEHDNVIAKMGLHDDEVAEERALALSMQHGKTITCLKAVVTVNAIMPEPRAMADDPDEGAEFWPRVHVP